MIAQADSQILLQALVHELYETPANICEFNPSPPASLIDLTQTFSPESGIVSLSLI